MHKKKVKGKFYYYTTVREGSRTKSIYLSKSFPEAKKKEQQLKSLGFNWQGFFVIAALLLFFFGMEVYYLYTTGETGFLLKLFGLTGLAIFETLNQTDFDEGSYNNTFYNFTGGYVQLPTDPGPLELPNDSVSDGWINMTGNTHLFHFSSNFTVDGVDDIEDNSGTGNNGTQNNTHQMPFFDSTGGKMGGAFEFDGVDDFINVSAINSPFPTITFYTISIWVKPDDVSDSNLIVKTAESPTMGWYFQLRINNSKFEHYVYDRAQDPSFTNVLGNTTVQVGEWYHVVGVVADGVTDGMKLYVNGIEEGAPETTTDAWAGGDRFFIGSNSGDNMGFFDGTIDEVAIWNRSLSAQEIWQIYQRTQGPYGDTGNYTSEVFDAGSTITWNNISWYNISSAETNITFQVCSSATSGCSDGDWLGYDNTSNTYFNSSPVDLTLTNLSSNRYFQYMAHFATNDSNMTPELYNVTSDYSDVTPPIVNLDYPDDFYNETATGAVVFNFTASDSGSGLDTCELWNNWTIGWHLNESFISPPEGVTNGSSNITLEDGTYVWNVWCNDTVGNSAFNGTNYTLNVDTVAPVINLNEPIDFANFSIALDFNYTASDAPSGLDTCELWGNWTTGWHLNETFINPTENSANGSSVITIEDGRYVWNVLCNDTVGNSGFNDTNYTLTIDATEPLVLIVNPEEGTTYSSSSVAFDFVVIDALDDLDSVWYTYDDGVTNTSLDATQNETLALSNADYTLTLYANDTLNNLNGTSVNFTVSVSAAAPSGQAGASGAGGKKYVLPELLVSPDLFKVQLKQGETKTVGLKINNTGGIPQAVSIDLQNLKKFILASEPFFILKPYEEKTLNLYFTAAHTESPEVYLGNIIVKSEYTQRIVSVIIEVLERKALFDVMVHIPEESRQVELGKGVEADIMMYNLGDLMPVDVILSYAIKDFEGNTFNLEQETFAIEEQKKLRKKVKVPEHLKPGFYVFYALLEYEEQRAVSSGVFEVKEKVEVKKFPLLEFLLVVIGVLSLIIVILGYRAKKAQQIKERLKQVEAEKLKFGVGTFMSDVEKKKIEGYIRQKLKEGYTERMILEAAKGSGWNEELVKILLGGVNESKREEKA